MRYIYTSSVWDAFLLKKGSARKLVLSAPQAATGVVEPPALCPAFRVRRGSRREYGSMTGRARRATRPTPSEFRHPSGDGADFGRRRRCYQHLRRPLRPALSRLAAAPAVDLGNPLGVGRGRPQERQL